MRRFFRWCDTSPPKLLRTAAWLSNVAAASSQRERGKWRSNRSTSHYQERQEEVGTKCVCNVHSLDWFQHDGIVVMQGRLCSTATSWCTGRGARHRHPSTDSKPVQAEGMCRAAAACCFNHFRVSRLCTNPGGLSFKNIFYRMLFISWF